MFRLPANKVNHPFGAWRYFEAQGGRFIHMKGAALRFKPKGLILYQQNETDEQNNLYFLYEIVITSTS
jgi:hypothetical protein